MVMIKCVTTGPEISVWSGDMEERCPITLAQCDFIPVAIVYSTRHQQLNVTRPVARQDSSPELMLINQIKN